MNSVSDRVYNNARTFALLVFLAGEQESGPLAIQPLSVLSLGAKSEPTGRSRMAAINSVADLTLDGDVAVLTINSPPVNALSAAVRDGLRDGMRQAAADPAAKAIVLICAGRTFIAGADISEFGKPPKGATLSELQGAIEGSPKPVIAAIHGTALGGGLEVALFCHYRVAVPSAKLGLPEIKLGLLPGAGGTQRLPRLIGPEAALEVILSGNPFGAKQALAWGVVDALVEEGKLREGALAFARKAIDEKLPLRRVRDLEDKIAPARGKNEIFEASRKANARKYRGFEAWEKAIELRARRGGAAVRSGHGERARRVHGARAVPAIAGAAPCVLRRAAGLEDRRRARRHADAADPKGRRHRRGHDGRRHFHELSQCRHSRHHRRDRAGRARSRPRRHPQELREHRQEGPDDARRMSRRAWAR